MFYEVKNKFYDFMCFCKGEDGPSDKPQKIGCYVQKCAVICAVTEDTNLSWEGW